MRKLLMASAVLIVLIAGLVQSASNIPTTPAPVVRSIQFFGLDSLKVEDILARWNERKLAFGVERRYDPKQAAQAGEQIRTLFAERNLGNVKVDVTTAPIPPRSLEVRFRVSPK